MSPGKEHDGAIVIGGDYRGLGLVRSLGRRGVPVWVLWEGSERLAGASRYARRNLPLRGGPASLRDMLLRLAREEGVAGWVLLPTSDHTVRAIAHDYEELARGFTVASPPWDVLRWAHDKRLTYQLAQEVGIESPRTFLPGDRDDLAALDCEFPVILKPAVKDEFNRFTADKAWRADDRRALLAHYDDASRLVPPDTIMVQELIPGDGRCQFSFAALCDSGRPLASVVARRTRQFPSDFGRASTFVETVEEPAVIEGSRRVLAVMGITGLVEVEFKRDARTGTLKLLDINPRAWGWHTIGATAGVDFPYLLWQLVHGDRVPEVHGTPGIKWKRLSWDLFAVASDLRSGRLTVRDYLASFSGPRATAIFAADDPLPGLVEVPLLFSTLFTRLAHGDAV